MDEKALANMRSRAERCRRLARGLDVRTAEILNQMASEIEADIARLSAGRDGAVPPTNIEPDQPTVQ